MKTLTYRLWEQNDGIVALAMGSFSVPKSSVDVVLSELGLMTDSSIPGTVFCDFQ